MGEWPGFPPPEIRARHAYHDEIPSAARKFYNLATANGWRSWFAYARGTWMEADGSPGVRTKMVPAPSEDGVVPLTPSGRPRTVRVVVGPRVVDDILVRCVRGDTMIVAGWIDGKFDFVRENLGQWLSLNEAKRWLKNGRPK